MPFRNQHTDGISPTAMSFTFFLAAVSVAGLNYEYVVKQLQDFKQRRRTNDAGNMTAGAGTRCPTRTPTTWRTTSPP